MSDEPRIQCRCGAGYAYRPGYAGRIVRCTCGRTLRMPDGPPHADDAAVAGRFEVDSFNLARREDDLLACPGCATLLPRSATLCPACGFDRTTGRRAPVERPPRERSKHEKTMIAESEADQRRRDYVAGTVLLAAVIAQLLWYPILGGGGPFEAMLLAMVWPLVAGLTCLGAAMIARQLIGVVWEPPTSAVLRLFAIATTVHVVRAVVVNQLISPPGSTLNYVVALGMAMMLIPILAFAFVVTPLGLLLLGLRWLFDLDTDEMVTALIAMFAADTMVYVMMKLAGLPG